MATLISHRRTPVTRTTAPGVVTQAGWYAVGAVIAFAVPYIFSSVLEWQHDLYYLTYFAAVGAFLGLYVLATRADLAGLFRRGWKLSLIVGVFSAALAANEASAMTAAAGSAGRPSGTRSGSSRQDRG